MSKSSASLVLDDENDKTFIAPDNHRVSSSMIGKFLKDSFVDLANDSPNNSIICNSTQDESCIFAGTGSEESSEGSLEQLLEFLRIMNQQMKEANDLQQKQLQLEASNFEKIKLPDLEMIKLGDTQKRKELKFYELNVRKICVLYALSEEKHENS